jgi:NAD(P)-dependent dehydrogenase (short-subunit alcohol dehydrogenase family)
MGMSRIAMVTGAGSGIGRASSLALLKEGWTVVLVGRRRDALEETASLSGAADRTLSVPTDVSKPDEVEALFAVVRQRYGRLDLLFNNAGTGAPSTNFGDLTWELWSRVVAVNLNGCFLMANAAFRLMREQSPQGGRIINNGSLSAHLPRPGSAPYTATKHAITGLTKTIALDGRPFDIAGGQIDIGNASTPMTRRMSGPIVQADGSSRIEPTMDVEAVGRTIVYMASLPPDANALHVTVMATKMPFVGRG